MKALVVDDGIRLDPQWPDPVPVDGEALIRVRLAGICTTDLELIKGYMNFHGVPGHEFVGDVVAGPPEWLGRRVVAEINCVCRRCDMCRRGFANHCRARTVLGIAGRNGAFAELLAVPLDNLHAVPDAVTDEQAVFTEPLAAAFQIIKQIPIDSRMHVAVLGSGRLGLLVAQVLQRTGCRLQVIGRNPLTLDFCEKHGIQTRAVGEIVPKADHDVVVDCTGDPRTVALAAELVRPRGTIVLKSTAATAAPLNLAPLVVNEINLLGSRCGPFPDALAALAADHIDVVTLISRTFDIGQGLRALQEAALPESIKILLRPNPPLPSAADPAHKKLDRA